MGFNVVGITSLLFGLLGIGYRNMGRMFLIIFAVGIVLPGNHSGYHTTPFTHSLFVLRINMHLRHLVGGHRAHL